MDDDEKRARDAIAEWNAGCDAADWQAQPTRLDVGRVRTFTTMIALGRDDLHFPEGMT